MPVGLKILQNIQMTQVMVWRAGLFLFGSRLKGLHLVVNEVARGNLTPAGNDLKSNVDWDASK